MFCPNCGNADQKENSYCRQCGEFLPDFSQKNKLAFGGNTPEEQIRINLVLNLMSAIVSFALAMILFVTFGFFSPQAPPIIYIVIAFLLAMSAWQASTFVIGLKLKKHFKKGKETETAPEPDKQFQAAETRELLNEADPTNAVPIGSVTENTTRKLKVKSE